MVYLNYILTTKIVLLILCVGFSNCANILGIFFCGAKSHHILGEVLLKELARRGHNVTMVSPFPLKESVVNYTDISLTEVLEDHKGREHLFLKIDTNVLAGLEVINMILTQVEYTFTNEDMQKLVNSGPKFDVIIIDWFISHSLLIYGDIFNAPVVLICSPGSLMASDITGNPSSPSFIPQMTAFPDNMTFLQRVMNTVGLLVFNIVEYVNIGLHESMLQKHFPNASSFCKLRERVALVLSNSHYSFESPRPYVPSMVPIGGFHVQEAKALPKDLKKLIDEAQHGVIFFSFGSLVKSKNLPKEKQQHIINVFRKIKETVLWKWEDDNTPDLPKNVIVRKWFPQNDILAHPNVKLFISHGGLLSTIEAIYHAKPVVGIPIFGDQKSNIFRAVEFGYAATVELKDLTEETLLAAIRKIIDNPEYTENVQKRSSLLKDQPISPMEKAVFWVEHVIKNKGAPHLRNAGVYLRWYQYLLLDVTLFLIAVVSFIIIFLYFSVRQTYRLLKFLLLKKIKKD